jgi:sec-independent protein translocase protein TatB
MFDIGMPEMIVIFVVALVVLGPKKLPEVAKALGKGLSEFKKTFQDVKESVDKEFKESTSDIRDTFIDVKKQVETEVHDAGKTISGTIEQAKEQVATETEAINNTLEHPEKNSDKQGESGSEGKK